VRTLSDFCVQRGLPGTIKTDNGSEFISKVMDKWAYERGVELDCSRPGKPTDNAIEAWRRYYNESRPHSALEWATPAEFARRCCLQAATAMSEKPEVSTSERY